MKSINLMLLSIVGVVGSLCLSACTEEDTDLSTDSSVESDQNSDSSTDEEDQNSDSSTDTDEETQITYMVEQLEYYREDGSNMKQVLKFSYDEQDRISSVDVERWYFYDNGDEDVYRSKETTTITYTSDTRIDIESTTDYSESAINSSDPYIEGFYNIEDGVIVGYEYWRTENSYYSYEWSADYTYDNNYLSTLSETIESSDYTSTLDIEASWSDGSCVGCTYNYERDYTDPSESDSTTIIESTFTYSDNVNPTNIDLNIYIGCSETLAMLFENLLFLGDYGDANMSSKYLLSSTTDSYQGDGDEVYNHSYEFNSDGAPISATLTRDGSTSTYTYKISYRE